MMGNLTIFAALLPVCDKAAGTVARSIIERIVNIFGPPETLHPDQGTDFKNKVIHQLQQILGCNRAERLRVDIRAFGITTRALHHAQHVGHPYRDRSKQLGITVTVCPISSQHHSFSAMMQETLFS